MMTHVAVYCDVIVGLLGCPDVKLASRLTYRQRLWMIKLEEPKEWYCIVFYSVMVYV